MYKIRGIILSRQRIRDRLWRISIFSEQYGRITGWYEKNSIPDIGGIITAQMKREQNKNTITSIEVQYGMKNIFSQYESIFEYLSLFWLLEKILAEWQEQQRIYQDIEYFILNCEKNKQNILFIQLRFLKRIWIARSEHLEKTPLWSYIYQRIDTSPLGMIMEPRKQLTAEDIFTVKKTILHSLDF